MTIQEKQKELVEEFNALLDWEDKYAEIIKMGRNLSPFPEEHRTEKNKIQGCQSQVWIFPEFNDGKVHFHADSDAMIVKGLIAILVKVYSGHTPEEITQSSNDFLTEMGIANHLSPTRKNGLGAMLKQIQLYAVAFNAMNN
ncbi:MAG: SufE family protein [Melioribacteraceae bacterium]|nr:SufE family protein [Melioribacteraceae bacterium]MCF8353802.1 SufE family protein [Melioribacteraceae bacterium]MCF8393638.1 SufE family protein [Melioribacteraceae bacterium]MCF8419448.1 SufE family protein [Melioribacteraceae bacterium]